MQGEEALLRRLIAIAKLWRNARDSFHWAGGSLHFPGVPVISSTVKALVLESMRSRQARWTLSKTTAVDVGFQGWFPLSDEASACTEKLALRGKRHSQYKLNFHRISSPCSGSQSLGAVAKLLSCLHASRTICPYQVGNLYIANSDW